MSESKGEKRQKPSTLDSRLSMLHFGNHFLEPPITRICTDNWRNVGFCLGKPSWEMF